MESSKLSPFQIRKFTTLFNYYDKNRNGFLTSRDYRAFADRLQRHYGWTDDDPKTLRLRESREAAFRRLVAVSDKDFDGRVSLAEYLRYFERQIEAYGQTGAATPALLQSCRELMDMLDRDGNGTISEKEYAALLKAMGSDANPSEVYARLDRAGRGWLTLLDLERLMLEFVLSQDAQAPGNFLYCGKI